MSDLKNIISSVASMMDIVEEKVKAENIAIINDNEDDDDNSKNRHRIVSLENNNSNKGLSAAKINMIHCQKNDGKGWQCKKEAKEGHTFCEHHLTLLRSYSNNNNNAVASSSCINQLSSSSISSKKAQTLAHRRTRGSSRSGKKTGTNSNSKNPYEFYYYSGFGPLWGRKRGDRNGNEKRNENGTGSIVVDDDDDDDDKEGNDAETTPRSSSSQMGNEGFHYVDEDDGDDDDEDDDDGSGGDSGKKRMRKPVKARSLKSLM